MLVQTEKLARLQRMSAWLAHAAKILALVLLAANAVVWLIPELANDTARSQSAIGESPMTLTLGVRAAALAVSLAHVGLMAAALWTAGRLFASISAGAIFVPGTGASLRRIGVLLLIFAAVSPIVRSLIGVIVTAGNEAGHRILALGISSNDAVAAMIAALLIVLGHVMAEAALIADDNRQIV